VQRLTFDFDDDDRLREEINVRLRREILEAEHALAHDLSVAGTLDKCISYVSFPIEAATTTMGAVATAATGNPLFLALGLAPAAAKWTLDAASDARRRKFTWHLYLMDFRDRLDRTAALRQIDQQLRALRNG
jgi:hypothetical protein